jgi:ribosomal protein L7/L12
MMKNLVINGWNVGLDKILLTKALRAEFGYSLSEGKSITDQVVDNREIRIPFDREPSVAEDFVKKLREIGAKASIEN